MFSTDNVISLSHVDVLQSNNLILQDVSFSISKAEFVYLVGNSGTGKSSLMKLLFGVLPCNNGTAEVAGFDLRTINQESLYKLRRKVSMIFQDFKLFEEWTVRENLGYVLRATEWKDATLIDKRIEEVLARTFMSDKINAPVYTLSGGEQQKIAIARAILNKPVLLLADEPTGNLDQVAAESIIRLFHEISLQQETAVFLTTHHHNILTKFPGRTLRCDDNKIVEL